MGSCEGKFFLCLPDIWRWSVLSFIGASKSFHQPRKKGSSKNESLTSMNTSFPAFFVLFSAMLFDIVAFDWISGSPVRVRPFQMMLVFARHKISDWNNILQIWNFSFQNSRSIKLWYLTFVALSLCVCDLNLWLKCSIYDFPRFICEWKYY